MAFVIKPAKKPPKLEEMECLSLAAQETLKALDKKYNNLNVSQNAIGIRNYNFNNNDNGNNCNGNGNLYKNNNDPVGYYKRIYENTFKRELISQPQDKSYGQAMSSRPKYPWQITNFKNKGNDINQNKIASTQHQQSNFSFGFPREGNQKNFSGFCPSINESPLLDFDIDTVPCNNFSRLREECIQECPEYITTSSPTISLSQSTDPINYFTESQSVLHKDNSEQNQLLKKWNRKFSQMVSQFEGDKEMNIIGNAPQHPFHSSHCTENVQKDLETIWIDELQTQKDNNASSDNVISVPPLGDPNNNHNTSTSALTESSVTFFAGADSDYREEENYIFPLQKNDKQSFGISDISMNSEHCNNDVKYIDNVKGYVSHQSEVPMDMDEVRDLFRSSVSDEERHFKSSKNSISDSDSSKMDESSTKINKINKRHVQANKRISDVMGKRQEVDISVKETKANNNKNIGNYSNEQISTNAKEDPLCDNSKIENVKRKHVERKRDNERAMQKMVKKFKSGFKPPTRQNSATSSEDDSANKGKEKKKIATGELQRDGDPELPTVLSLFNLSPDKQQQALDEIYSAQLIALTVVLTNGVSLINHFHSSVDWSKDSSMMILTAGFNCYQLTINSNTQDRVKEILFQILHNNDCESIIPNSKEFLSCSCKMLHLDTNQAIYCERLEDPVLASWLLNPDKPPSSFSLMCQTAHVKFTGADNDWLACLCFTNKLMTVLKKRLEGNSLLKLYRNVEVKLVPLLSFMENQSLRVDIEIFRKFADILKTKLHKLEESAYKEVGHKFSINSHPQLRQILFEELKLDEKLPPTSKIGKTSVSNHKSTCESSLLLLAELHPLPSIILEYRSLQKLKSTYIDGMLSCMCDHSISTHWDQTSAATGRLTSYQPNIQNIPKTVVVVQDYLPNTSLGSAPKSSAQIYAREPFICHEGFVFLAADFQQIELRVLAHLSDDRALLSMFWNPASKDIFSLLTAEWKSVDVDAVSNEDRETTKRIVYSVMYGVGKEKLADYLKVKPDVAKEVMQNFLARFPAIDSFTKKCCSYAKEYGHTETICGRRRYFPYINSTSPALRAQAQRQAVNFCVQGSAADICKLAMLEVESSLRKHSNLNYRLLLQIHDELLWEVAEDQLLKVKEIIENVMQNAKTLCHKFCSLQVPLTVSFSQGKSWAHLTPMVQVESTQDKL